jgi:Zn-dependent protease
MADRAGLQSGFPGAVRLFRFAGIDVFLHWSWAIVAFIELQTRTSAYDSQIWNVAEYLTLFGIVLLHEFGHALACRSVGGRADRILLWPLGGVAYVDPPRRPGATLWSIAAGPLVNVLLVPVTIGAAMIVGATVQEVSDDMDHYLFAVAFINIALLVFNMLPIYPLDGGQIVQSILWYFVGLPRSLAIASTIGIIGAAGLVGLALYLGDWWLIVLAIFGASRSRQGFQQAKSLSRLLASPRFGGLQCPSCGESPIIDGVVARCPCGQAFDPFSAQGRCPACGGRLAAVPCALCHRASPMEEWQGTSASWA